MALPAAAADPATVEEWVSTLTSTYQKEGGYLASYRSEGEGKLLEVTMAADPGTRLGMIFFDATKNGKTLTFRFWNTPEDRCYMQQNQSLTRMDGTVAELDMLLNALFDQPAEMRKCLAVVGFFLSPDQIRPNFGFGTHYKPSWASKMEDATVQEVTEKSVTFRSAEHGLVTVSRASGIMTRQSIAGLDGEKRVLELSSYEPRPGLEKLRQIAAAWEKEPAATVSREMLGRPARLMFCQALVSSVEAGNYDFGLVEKHFTNRAAAFRDFAAQVASNNPESKINQLDWKKALDESRRQQRVEWLKDAREGQRDEAAYEKYLDDPAVRAGVRDGVLPGLDAPPIRALILTEYFGPNAQIAATNEPGRATKELLEDALVKAYVSTIIDREMVKHWGEATPPQ